jgi:Rab-GTPase-TBC domain
VTGDSLDKQFTYYTLKMLENVFYPHKRRVTIMNNETYQRSILEDVCETEYYVKLHFESLDFWETYYRHNNYFLEKNSSLLHKIKHNKNFVQANTLNQNSIGFEQFIEFYDVQNNSLSHIGVRVCSLLDIIKIQAALGLTVSIINRSVKFLSDRFKVSKEVIERVFRAGEEAISLRWFKPAQKQRMSKVEVFQRVLEFLDPVEGLRFISTSKTNYEQLRQKWIKHILLTTDSLATRKPLRLQIWTALVPERIKQKQLMSLEEARAQDKARSEPLEELIDMDLKRSVNFFDKEDYDQVKRLLMNVSLAYADSISYYQGMNYIGIFIFDAFKDEEAAFHFFCYLAENLLQEHFSNSFQGVVRLIWINDKLMQIHSSGLWDRLRNGGVSSIHFAVPNIITLFASLVKKSDRKEFIFEIWDVMLASGLYSILKTLTFVLEMQKIFIDEIDPELLLLAMKDVESDPFSLLAHAESEPATIRAYMAQLNKKNMRDVKPNPRTYLSLAKFYDEVVSEIAEFWAAKS